MGIMAWIVVGTVAGFMAALDGFNLEGILIVTLGAVALMLIVSLVTRSRPAAIVLRPLEHPETPRR